jgi:penicillin-binding protein 2
MPLFDKKDKSRYATFTRRSVGMGVGMTAVFAVLAGRLYQLQIRDGAEYMVEAEDNRISERPLVPPRGRILDRFGVELATNKRNYRVLLVSEQATEGVSEAIDTLAKVIEISDAQKKRILHDIAQNKKFVPVPVAENLTWEEYSRVNMHLPYLPGIEPGVGETRDYPFSDQMVHILGYVAAVSPEDKNNDDDPLLDQPGFRIGKRGIEKQYDGVIRGEAGDSKVEVDAHGRVIRDLDHEAGEPGKDIWLTIDAELQKYIAQRMADQSAACVVMDTDNGDVLALASTPRLRPQLVQQWRQRSAMARAHHLRIQAAAEQGHQRHLSARLDVQDRDGAGGGGQRDGRSCRQLQRLDAAWRPCFLLRCLENRRPRQLQPATRHTGLVRYLLL